MTLTLLLTALSGPMLIERSKAEAYLPVISELYKNPTADFSAMVPKSNTIAILKNNTYLTAGLNVSLVSTQREIQNASTPSVAIIPLQGAVMKNDYCGAMGTKSIANMFLAVENNPNIIGTILYTDSPGGAVDGTLDCASIIKGTQKPSVAYIDGMMCSAAMWIGSACNELYASNKLNEVGSIGTYCSIQDFSGYFEKNGIVVRDIYSRFSTEKNGPYKEALAGNDEPMKDRLDFITSEFHKTIKNNLGKNNLDAHVFTGASYYAQEAQSKGLINGIKPLKYAINRVIQLSKNKSI